MIRGRGGGAYQAPRGGGRGRGSPGGRGALNAAASSFNPGTGMKRPREEGSIGGPQGNGGKRPRGGGQES